LSGSRAAEKPAEHRLIVRIPVKRFAGGRRLACLTGEDVRNDNESNIVASLQSEISDRGDALGPIKRGNRNMESTR
jgi:hypothetical protein